MPARRRQTLSRSPTQRFKMWNAKMDGETYRVQLAAVKPLAQPKMASYMATHEFLISLVRNIIAKTGDNPSIMQEYMWYAEKLEKLSRTYSGRALQLQVDALYLWYLARGLSDTTLRAIPKALGLNVSSTVDIVERVLAPILLKIVGEGTITADGSEQELIEYVGLTTLTGYLDLSNMEDGDSVTVREYVKLRRDKDYTLYYSEAFTGKQPHPALHFLPRVTGYAFKITLQQVAGAFKSFDYIFIREV